MRDKSYKKYLIAHDNKTGEMYIYDLRDESGDSDWMPIDASNLEEARTYIDSIVEEVDKVG